RSFTSHNTSTRFACLQTSIDRAGVLQLDHSFAKWIRPQGTSMSFPTIIVRDPKENPKKCSILPLKGRADLVFFTFPVRTPPDLQGYVRLAAEGPELTSADRDARILLLDGSWRSADKMTRAFEHVSPRSLHGWKTAYPRVSKLGTDPDNGLASIEALYIAYHVLGRPTAGLLDHYHWAASFLEANGLAVSMAEPEDRPPSKE